MSVDITKAKNYLDSVNLQGTKRFGIVPMDATSDAGGVFDNAKQQAQTIGSGVFSFAQGVTADVRKAISNSALLAHLVAKQKFPNGSGDTFDQFNVYSEVLQNIGWVLQDSGTNEYTADGTDVEVNEKILGVLTAALGPGAAALPILKATIEALQGMDSGNSWLTIFKRESQQASIAHFQIGLVEKGEGDDVFVSLLACLINAETTNTQVIFFKWSSANADFKTSTAKLSINSDSVTALQPTIVSKVQAYQLDYLSSIKDLPPLH